MAKSHFHKKIISKKPLKTSETIENKEETKPDETKPEETKPEETKPEETKPEETKPEETKPDETKPDETKPEETKPEETKPEETKPEGTKPEEIKPEETKPEETKPHFTPSKNKKTVLDLLKNSGNVVEDAVEDKDQDLDEDPKDGKEKRGRGRPAGSGKNQKQNNVKNNDTQGNESAKFSIEVIDNIQANLFKMLSGQNADEFKFTEETKAVLVESASKMETPILDYFKPEYVFIGVLLMSVGVNGFKVWKHKKEQSNGVTETK